MRLLPIPKSRRIEMVRRLQSEIRLLVRYSFVPILHPAFTIRVDYTSVFTKRKVFVYGYGRSSCHAFT